MINDCPYCGKPMRSGYVQSFRPIYFNEGRKRFFASGDLRSKSISDLGVIKAPSVPATYCEHCKKIILNLEKL